MELWTEYEGRTIDGTFPLKKLLLPEGRSAFFSTSNGQGVPTVIRLIASHFDEEEILARWRGVDALGHPNILKTEKYGQMILDDTTVVYAVFEPVDANLAEVISGQQLDKAEGSQLASSLASALEVLHSHGFVHEHVEPANVFAVGEVVKLRGDCIRETPEGEAGLDAKRQDVHDFALVLLRALTQTDTLESASRVRPLPVPFDGIVRNGLTGTWGLDQITAALHAAFPAAKPAVVAPAAAAPAAPPMPPVVVAPTQTKDTSKADADPVMAREASETPVMKGSFVPPATRPFSVSGDEEDEALPRGNQIKWLAGAGVIALLLIWLVWHVAHGKSASQRAAAQTITQPTPASGSASVSPATGQASAATGQPKPPHSTKPTAAGSLAPGTVPSPAQRNSAANAGKQWRVVAFTYNRADQAQKKADTIAQKHGDLRPEVFTPTGRAPYLVTVGGVMSRDQAFAFAQRARKQGLPRDTYAQNYEGKRR